MARKPTYEELERRVRGLELEEEKLEEAKEELRKSEERYRTLLENVPIGVYRNTPGPKGRFLTANPAFFSMFGFDSEEEIKRTRVVDLYMNPGDRVEFSDNLLARGSVTGVELRLKKRGGTPIWGSVTARVIYDEKGEVAFFDCTIEDITARRQANEALQDNEGRYRLLVDTMNDGLGVQDENGLITFVNDRFCKIVGYRKEEIIGHPVTDLLDKDNQIILKEQMVKRRKGERRSYEIAWTKKDGKKIPTIMSPSPIFDAQSNFIGSFAVITDIEDRKRKEEEILQQKEFLNNILESLTHPFYVIDAMDYTIKMANLAAGMGSLKENTTCYALTHKRDKPCGGVEHICPLEQVKKTKKPATAEHIHYDKEGNLRNVEVYAFPIFDNRGNVIQAIEYNLDITKRKRAEEQLTQAYEKMKSTQAQLIQSAKLASIGELSSGVAHELNQPLMVIRSIAQLTQRTIEKDHLGRDELKRQLKRIERNTKRMMNIINHLRTFSRQSPLDFHPVDINKVIGNSLLMTGEQLRLHDIEVKKDLTTNLPKIQGDANQLEQVILNLIINARDAIEAAGNKPQRRIEMATRISDGVKGVIEILVKDTGSGISQECLEKIFDPFFTTKEVGEGTGLGLSISYGIIKDHKGEIEVAETGPKGTIFRIKLPISDLREAETDALLAGNKHTETRNA